MDNIVNAVLNFLSSTGLHIAQAIIILLVGLFVIKKVSNILKIGLIKTTNNRTMSTFVTSILNVVLTFFLVMIVFNILSIPTDGIMQLLSACVLAVGLSLKDSVNHLASGLIIVSTKPFKEGDFVNINGVEGKVKAVHMFNTQVKTTDNKIITVPNSNIVSDNIINYDALATRRIDIRLYVAYGSDLDKCKKVFEEVVKKTKLTLKTPEPEYLLDNYGSSSIEFVVRVWVRSANYWNVRDDLMKSFYNAMNENGIEIPFNTLDLNIRNVEKSIHIIDTKEEK